MSDTRRRRILGTLLAGVVLQLAGLGWATFLSQTDQGLGERESALSLANPSHLLILLGLATVVAGAGWLLMESRLREGGNSLRGPAVVPVVAMVVILAGTSAFAIRNGGIAGSHSDGHSDGAAGGDHHGDATAVEESPTAIALKNVLKDDGTEAALAKLDELAKADERILAQAHSFVHMIGRLSFERYGSAKEAFPRCSQAFESGCYHGVLEAHLEQSGALRPDDIASLCEDTTGPEGSTNLRFQCVHGLGHGLSLYYNQDLVQTLGSCDYLRSEWERQSCYGGAFMQNIVAAREILLVGGGAQPVNLRPYLRTEDPQYPCNAVDVKYVSACYFLQSSAFLLLNNQDFPEAFRQCDRAPADQIWLCYNSLGRDASSAALWDTKKSLEICQLGTTPAQIPQCYAGVAANLIGVDWTTDRALEFCGLVPEGGKTACYTSIGQQVATLYADEAARARECGRGEERFAETCLAAARSYRTS